MIAIGLLILLAIAIALAKSTDHDTAEPEVTTAPEAAQAAFSGCWYLVAIALLLLAVTFGALPALGIDKLAERDRVEGGAK